ncbi:ammonium transporter AmtB-like domain-containing protein [Zopfochytrium polystomum]|nr:ammonium transporter AmtB-like domain-containing protein [Zopfochytrium polystomum]
MATTNSTIDPFLPSLGGLDQTSNGFLLWGAALVFVMTPGLGFFYSGMSRSKNALTMIMLCMAAMCVISIQWVIFGFSLAFSEGSQAFSSGSVFIGDAAHFGLTGVGFDALRIAPAVSAITFCIYQMQFATITGALIFGSVAERVRIIPALIFIFCWTTVIYDPIAYWTWSWRGWIRNFSCISTGADGTAPCGTGGLDFAGGGPVHIASGFAGLAYCIILGKRRRVGTEEFKPHNLANVFLGTALLWFGWFAFNGGSAVAGTARAAMAGAVTHIATATGALAWPLTDYVVSRKMSGLGFCSGAVAALVAITPASGFVAPWAAIIIGAAAGIVCNFACRIKGFFGFDDALDAWGVHGIGGFLGNVLTGVLAQRWIPTLDGTNSDTVTIVPGGAVDGHWVQIGWQVAGSTAIAVYSFVGSFILLTIINYIPGLKLRVDEDDEILGGDLGEMGEVAYELVSSIVEPYPGSNAGSPKMEGAVVV